MKKKKNSENDLNLWTALHAKVLRDLGSKKLYTISKRISSFSVDHVVAKFIVDIQMNVYDVSFILLSTSIIEN